MSASNDVNWVRLGDYIEQRREKNKGYDVPIRGVTKEGFISPKQDGDLSMYNVFYRYDFVFNPARMEINSIALNTEFEKAICSSLYEVFYVKDTNVLSPEFLNLFLKRDEFARYCWFDAIGSARNYYRVYNLAEVKIPLPSIEVQRELVSVYSGLKSLAEENEALLQPLSEACQAFIVDCKNTYPSVMLGEYIEECDERNRNGQYGIEDVRGISIQKKLIYTKADMTGVSLSPYKVMLPRDFCYVTVTSRNGGKISLAMNDEERAFIVSSSYITFRSKDEDTLLPEYLYMLLSRSEFDRYSRFNSWGSARETFDWSELCRVEIPLPPLSIQKKVADLYKCYAEAKSIAEQAREQLKTICPALVQKAAHTA